jgi:hypothetical protein
MIDESGERFIAYGNLGAALLRMRYPDKPRVLWADAICINQEDNEEKMKQVEMMHDVYKNASQVLVWLGEAVEGTDKAFQWIAEQPSRTMTLLKQYSRVLKTQPDFLVRAAREPLAADVQDGLRKIGQISVPEKLFKPMNDLLQRSYFERVWMIQEVYFADQIQVYCGTNSIDWDTFVAACASFSSYYKVQWEKTLGGKRLFFGPARLAETRGLKQITMEGPAFDKVPEPYRTMWKLSTKVNRFTSKDHIQQLKSILDFTKKIVQNASGGPPKYPERDLLDCLVSYWPLKATDDRDNVYALLNLTNCKTIKPTFSKSVTTSEIFKDVAFKIMAESRRLDILTLCNCARETKLGLPSWAPDWANYDGTAMSLEPNQKWRRYDIETPLMQPYKASAGTLTLPPIRNGNVLSLSGYLVDQLVEVGPHMPSFVTNVELSGELIFRHLALP